MLQVFLKPSPILKVGLITDSHSIFVHDEDGNNEKWIVSGVIRSLSTMDNGMVYAVVEDEDLDVQVPFLRHL